MILLYLFMNSLNENNTIYIIYIYVIIISVDVMQDFAVEQFCYFVI